MQEEEEACLLAACMGLALGLALLARLLMSGMTSGASAPCLPLPLAWVGVLWATCLHCIKLRRNSRYRALSYRGPSQQCSWLRLGAVHMHQDLCKDKHLHAADTYTLLVPLASLLMVVQKYFVAGLVLAETTSHANRGTLPRVARRCAA